MSTVVCGVLRPIAETFKTVGPTIVLIMFLYGAVKYAYSADDPGGRKQAKSIVIQSIIAGILLLMVAVFMTILGLDDPAMLCGVDPAL
jgi:cbb3-type cytochrome oxidase subunit 3